LQPYRAVNDRSDDQLRPAAHTTTGEWQSFEVRMRQRRVERLVSRAESAIHDGHPEDLADALEEVRRLAPDNERVIGLEQALATSRAVETAHAGTIDDLPLAMSVTQISPRIESETDEASDLDEAASPPRTQKLLLAAASVIVAAAGLLVYGIYTAPEEQLRGLFPGVGDSHVPPPPVARQPTAQVPTGQRATQSARVSVETVEAAAVLQRTTSSPQPLAQTTDAASPVNAMLPASPIASEALNLPTGTSGAPTAPPPPQRDVALNALNAGAERTSPSPVSNVPDNTPAEPRPDAVAAVALAPPPKPERAAAPSPSAEYVAVLDVLNKYAAAYSRLDAAAAQEVWPAVNRPALAHAFDGLASQHVALERCDVSLSTESAHANCNGFATWSPKIGNSAAHTDACNWTFQLAKAGTDWQIVSARVQKR